MPVAEQVRVNTHTGNGSTTNFAYGYRIFEDADLTVTVDGVLQTLTTDYTVNGANDAGGGTIDFITAPINLSVVTLSGELAYDRDIDYIPNGPFPAQTFDNDHDKAIMLIQQLRRDVKRAIKVPIEETTDQEVSSTPANRANKILAFDTAGLPIASSLTDLESTLSTVDTSLVLASSVLSVAIPNRQAVAGGTVDAITATFSPVIAALANNIECIVEASGANATTTPNFTPDGLVTKDIVKGNDVALAVADIPGANYRMHLVFDATLDKWILLNPASIVDLKTNQTVAGKKTFSNNLITTKGADVASAAALPLITDGNYFDVTGTTAITSMDTVGVGAVIRLHFDAILTLTHHATDLVLPGGINITTAAGDEAEFVEYATGDWRCVNYQKASGHPLQVIQALQTIDTTNRSTTSTSFVTSSVTQAITPKSASNKVKITVSGYFGASNASGVMTVTLDRDSTDLTPAGVNGLAQSTMNDTAVGHPFSFTFIDSPASASEVIYSVFFKVSSGTGYLGRRGLDTSLDVPTIITTEEIVA